MQNDHDFVESATEAISEYTKDLPDCSKVPLWNVEEVDEIITAQVNIGFIID